MGWPFRDSNTDAEADADPNAASGWLGWLES